MELLRYHLWPMMNLLFHLINILRIHFFCSLSVLGLRRSGHLLHLSIRGKHIIHQIAPIIFLLLLLIQALLLFILCRHIIRILLIFSFQSLLLLHNFWIIALNISFNFDEALACLLLFLLSWFLKYRGLLLSHLLPRRGHKGAHLIIWDIKSIDHLNCMGPVCCVLKADIRFILLANEIQWMLHWIDYLGSTHFVHELYILFVFGGHLLGERRIEPWRVLVSIDMIRIEGVYLCLSLRFFVEHVFN